MFHPTVVHADTPRAIRKFVQDVVDTHLRDAHAMLRLPRPEVGIAEGCNFAISCVLMNVISGLSVVLYAPPADGKSTGRRFRQAVRAFYPWDTEPADAIRNGTTGGRILYRVFRNSLVHGLGFQDPEPAVPTVVTRMPGPGMSEDALRTLEDATARPDFLRDVPTLRTGAGRTELNAEALYWGVRQVVFRLTADTARVAAAEGYLGPMLRTGSVPVVTAPPKPSMWSRCRRTYWGLLDCIRDF